MTGQPPAQHTAVAEHSPVADDPTAFAAGLEDGLYPRPRELDGVRGVTMTTATSWWAGSRCERCHQSFRRGDRVLVGAVRRVRHLDPGLRCASASEQDRADAHAGQPAGPGAPAQPDGPQQDGAQPDADQDLADFAQGLLAAWPPLGCVPVRALADDDWRIARPGGGASPPTCPACGHTFRAGDHVIVCPCSPDAPHCGAAVHRDPASGLTCWDDWRPDGVLTRCPVTLERPEPLP
jgi:hypothetical protein